MPTAGTDARVQQLVQPLGAPYVSRERPWPDLPTTGPLPGQRHARVDVQPHQHAPPTRQPTAQREPDARTGTGSGLVSNHRPAGPNTAPRDPDPVQQVNQWSVPAVREPTRRCPPKPGANLVGIHHDQRDGRDRPDRSRAFQTGVRTLVGPVSLAQVVQRGAFARSGDTGENHQRTAGHPQDVGAYG